MTRFKERYVNPHTDFGFKRLFGTEFNKELLISFLNALFRGEQTVTDVTYLNPEQLKLYEDNLKAYRDIDNAIKTAEKEKFAEGLAEGLAEGEKKKAQEVAKRMKAMGLTAEQIAEATGLTPQEVERT